MTANSLINTSSSRVQEARLGKSIGKAVYKSLLFISLAIIALAALSAALGKINIFCILLSLAILSAMPAIWWRKELSILPPSGNDYAGLLSKDVLSRLKKGVDYNPRSLFGAVSDHWQSGYILNHLLLTNDLVSQNLSENPADLKIILETAKQYADTHKTPVIELGFVVGAMLQTNPGIQQMLIKFKAEEGDTSAVINWLGRNINELDGKKSHYGGIARDWAFGFTPLLNRFGHNLSRDIMNGGGRFEWLTGSPGVVAVEAAFDNQASAVALVGPDGIGKTTSAYALAQRLIEGDKGRRLAYHEVVSLNATDITSIARAPGDLEQIMIKLANEANRAGHILLFFDNAQLFFGGGPGSFDATQILLSIIEARSAPIILAMTPHDYESLKIQNTSLANLLTPVVMQEPEQADIMHSLEDAVTGFEYGHGVLIAYEALHEAFRLSGRYDQDLAYPGKAIKLLEASIAHSQNSIVTTDSVQQAIEQTKGVKVATAAPAEADQLLNLEAKIHESMIDQEHAVSVVSNALRRARAGVANPKRPIGSFLFLGPTGVGKTELAKAIAATYFNDAANMIRLDMSEYQQPDDVQRLLSDGAQETGSLIMAVRQKPFSVVLLDEIEKAHPNVLNLLLQLFDEGQLTDIGGKAASFKDCIIIVTSNAGAQTIREKVEAGQRLESFQEEFTNQLIDSGQFKPELLNRFDEIVLFGPLKPEELTQVVRLMLAEINQTLANQNITVELTDQAIAAIVKAGYDPRLGARPMRRTLQKAVEDVVAEKILKNEISSGDHAVLDVADLKIPTEATTKTN